MRTMNAVAQSLSGWTESEAQERPLDAVFRIVNEDSGARSRTPSPGCSGKDGSRPRQPHGPPVPKRARHPDRRQCRAHPDAAGRCHRRGAGLPRHHRAPAGRARADARARAREGGAARVWRPSARSKDEFVTTLSHELRTPLNAIFGWVHLLRSGALDEAARSHALEVIERNTRTQTRMVEDLLDMSRIMTGNFRIEPRPVDLEAVIGAAVDAVRPALDAKGVHLATHLDATAGPVAGDPDRLQQVVWNLLTNAIKFTPRGGRVEVRLERHGSQVQVEVSDTGRGIAADFLPHVFERFTQAEASSSRTQPGLGIGLALVRHLVELHGGTVGVSSDGDGQGATFTVRLPVPVTLERLRADGCADPRARRARGGSSAAPRGRAHPRGGRRCRCSGALAHRVRACGGAGDGRRLGARRAGRTRGRQSGRARVRHRDAGRRRVRAPAERQGGRARQPASRRWP